MKPRMLFWGSAAVVSILAACGDVERQEEFRTTAAASGAEERKICNPRKIAVSSGQALFTEIVDVAVDSRGRIFIADEQKPAITVLSAEGEVLRMIGREGNGPGEFDYIRNVQILPGDSLLVYDMGLERITVFAPGLREVAYTISLAMVAPGTYPSWVKKLTGKDAYFAVSTAPYQASGDNPAKDYERKQVVRLLAASGSVRRDSVLVVRAGQSVLVARRSRSTTITSNPFGRPGVLEVGPDGRIYYGFGDSLTIDIYSLRGERVGGFSKPYTPPPVIEEDIDDLFSSESEARTFRATLERFLEVYASGQWPAFKNFIVDDRGRVWVGLIEGRVVAATGDAAGATEWAVFTPSGTHLCTVQFSKPTELMLVQSGKAYGVVTNEVGVPRIVIYRIGEPLSSGGESA